MSKKPIGADPFEIRDREGVGVLFGVAGPTGAGKSFTAARLARGLAALPGEDLTDPATLAEIDARVAVLDTESRRFLHYMCAPGEMPSAYHPARGARFRFKHADLHAPFTPEAYEALIDAADLRGYKVIIIDSWSHCWDGEDGLTDIHSAALDALVEQGRERAMKSNGGNLPSWWRDDQQRDKLSITAWNKPKQRNKRLVNRMLQARAHIVICMRAEDKLRIETEKEIRQKRNGDDYEVTKTKVTAPKDLPPAQRWVPICEKRLPYEFTVGVVLTPENPGKPYAMKPIQQQLRPFFDLEQPIDEQTGVRLAVWASGAKPASGPLKLEQSRPATDGHSSPDHGPTGGDDVPQTSSPPLSPPPPDGEEADLFPGDVIEHKGQRLLPNRPARIEAPLAISHMEPDDVTAHATILAKMIKLAPAQHKQAWLDAQGTDLAALRARVPSWVRKLEALVAEGAAPPAEENNRTGTDDY